MKSELVIGPTQSLEPVRANLIACKAGLSASAAAAHRLSEGELVACRALGLAPEDLAEAKQKERDAEAAAASLSEAERGMCRITGTDPEQLIAAKAAAPGVVLTKEDLAVCKLFNTAPADFAASKAAAPTA